MKSYCLAFYTPYIEYYRRYVQDEITLAFAFCLFLSSHYCDPCFVCSDGVMLIYPFIALTLALLPIPL